MAARKRNRKRNQASRTQFTPRNPHKYKGEYPIFMRSSWEISFAQNCDANPNILEWASEPVQIPYFDPLTKKQKVYIPDFLIRVIKKKQRGGALVTVIETVLIELKPAHETFIQEARNRRDAAMVLRNRAKWQQAGMWCRRRGVLFKILTEKDLFLQKKKAPAKRRAPARKATLTKKP